jgi:NAD(P)-dependent dehydrogenase (short-subunit alcohol dehydrogenase family)
MPSAKPPKKAQSEDKGKVFPLLPPSGPLRLTGKVAVITGASRGIGYAVAKALAMEGCDVVITGREPGNLTKAASQMRKEVLSSAKILAVPCDVRVPERVAGLFAVVKKRLGNVDVLFNNAGIIHAPAPIEQTTHEMWRDTLDTNLTGMYLCTRAALPLMQRGSTIINNLSAAAKQVFPNLAAYTASKMGAYGFTLSIRQELIPRGIRVTALMPGATSTDIWQVLMPNADRDLMINVDQVAQAVLYAVLLPPETNLSELLLTPTVGAV